MTKKEDDKSEFAFTIAAQVHSGAIALMCADIPRDTEHAVEISRHVLSLACEDVKDEP